MKPEDMTVRGRTRRRWQNNIKTDLKEKGQESLDWVGLVGGR